MTVLYSTCTTILRRQSNWPSGQPRFVAVIMLYLTNDRSGMSPGTALGFFWALGGSLLDIISVNIK